MIKNRTFYGIHANELVITAPLSLLEDLNEIIFIGSSFGKISANNFAVNSNIFNLENIKKTQNENNSAIYRSRSLQLQTPTQQPTVEPTISPSSSPTLEPTSQPTSLPTKTPTIRPTKYPTFLPTYKPSTKPTARPSKNPTLKPTRNPTLSPSLSPTLTPTQQPTAYPTNGPTRRPSKSPTLYPSPLPTYHPTGLPTLLPSQQPITPTTIRPTHTPSQFPTKIPTYVPTTLTPSSSPTIKPSTAIPSQTPSTLPTRNPTRRPIIQPTQSPSSKHLLDSDLKAFQNFYDALDGSGWRLCKQYRNYPCRCETDTAKITCDLYQSDSQGGLLHGNSATSMDNVYIITGIALKDNGLRGKLSTGVIEAFLYLKTIDLSSTKGGDYANVLALESSSADCLLVDNCYRAQSQCNFGMDVALCDDPYKYDNANLSPAAIGFIVSSVLLLFFIIVVGFYLFKYRNPERKALERERIRRARRSRRSTKESIREDKKIDQSNPSARKEIDLIPEAGAAFTVGEDEEEEKQDEGTMVPANGFVTLQNQRRSVNNGPQYSYNDIGHGIDPRDEFAFESPNQLQQTRAQMLVMQPPPPPPASYPIRSPASKYTPKRALSTSSSSAAGARSTSSPSPLKSMHPTLHDGMAVGNWIDMQDPDTGETYQVNNVTGEIHFNTNSD